MGNNLISTTVRILAENNLWESVICSRLKMIKVTETYLVIMQLYAQFESELMTLLCTRQIISSIFDRESENRGSINLILYLNFVTENESSFKNFCWDFASFFTT